MYLLTHVRDTTAHFCYHLDDVVLELCPDFVLGDVVAPLVAVVL